MHPWESLHLRSRHCAAAPTPRPLQDKASVRSACAMVWLLERTRKALLLLGPALAPVEVRTSDLQRIRLPGCSAVPTARAALMPTAPSSYEYRFRCHPTPVLHHAKVKKSCVRSGTLQIRQRQSLGAVSECCLPRALHSQGLFTCFTGARAEQGGILHSIWRL